MFGVFAPTEQSVYLVPVQETSNFMVSLRVEPTLNNQRRGVRFAADYAIGRWSAEALTDLLSEPARLRLVA